MMLAASALQHLPSHFANALVWRTRSILRPGLTQDNREYLSRSYVPNGTIYHS
jgi:hypothetical protein